MEHVKRRVGRPFRAGQVEQCANFVRDAFATEGMSLPVTKRASDGLSTGPALANSLAGDEIGIRVKRSELQPGDILFFSGTYGNYGIGVITHVAIYAGDGMMVHRPTAARPISYDAVNRAGHFFEARRPRMLTSEDAVDRTIIDFRAGVASAKVKDKPAAILTLALTAEHKVYVNNAPVRADFVTVEVEAAGKWHKAYHHDGRWSFTGMKNCKMQMQGGALQVQIDGVGIKPSSCRFEVVTT